MSLSNHLTTSSTEKWFLSSDIQTIYIYVIFESIDETCIVILYICSSSKIITMSLTEHNSGDVLLTGSLSRVDSGRDRRPLSPKAAAQADSGLPFYMGDIGNSLPNMPKKSGSLVSRSSDSQCSSLYDSPDMSPKGEQVFKFDLIGPGSKSIGYTVCTSSSTSKLLKRPKPKSVVSLAGDTSPTGPHKFLRESRSLDREDETDRFPEPRQLKRQETFDSSTSSVQALHEKINNNNLIGRPPLRTAKSFDFGYKSPASGESQNGVQPPSGSDTLTINSNNTAKVAPSPATKRRIKYFQKLASSVLSGSRSAGPTSPKDRKSMSGSGESLSGQPSSPDHTSSDEGGFDSFSPPSSPTTAVMHKGRQSTSPSSKFMPKKIWRTRSKPQSTSAITTLWNPEVSYFIYLFMYLFVWIQIILTRSVFDFCFYIVWYIVIYIWFNRILQS